MKRILALVLAAVMVFSLAACSTKEAPAAAAEPAAAEENAAKEEAPAAAATATSEYALLKGKKIGISTCYIADEFCIRMCYGIHDNLKALGADCTLADGGLDAEVQTKQIETMLADGIDYLFCFAPSEDALLGVFEKCNEAGVPIILFDSDANWDDVVTRIGRDWPTIGRTAAQGVVDSGVLDKFKGKTIKVVRLFDLSMQRNWDTNEAWLQTLKENGFDYEIVAELDSQSKREVAENVISGFVGTDYDLICGCDINAAWGAVAALEAKGKTKDDILVLPAAAYDEETAVALRDGTAWWPCITWSAPERCAALSVSTMMNLLYYPNKEIPRQTIVEVPIVNRDNIEEHWNFKD